LLVAKEKKPATLIELGPPQSRSRGLVRGGALADGERWLIKKKGHHRFVALAIWFPDKILAKTCADFSDLEIGPDGCLYLLSDKSATIARLDEGNEKVADSGGRALPVGSSLLRFHSAPTREGIPLEGHRRKDLPPWQSARGRTDPLPCQPRPLILADNTQPGDRRLQPLGPRPERSAGALIELPPLSGHSVNILLPVGSHLQITRQDHGSRCNAVTSSLCCCPWTTRGTTTAAPAPA
jgi:hypothetical protein